MISIRFNASSNQKNTKKYTKKGPHCPRFAHRTFQRTEPINLPIRLALHTQESCAASPG